MHKIEDRHDRRRNGLAKQRRSESRSRAAGEAMSGGAVAWFTCVREIITESY